MRGQGGGAGSGAQCEAMGFGQRRFAGHGAEHRRRQQLRELRQCGAGAGRQHPGTGPDQRPSGCAQQFRGGGDVGARRRLTGGPRRAVGLRCLRHLLSTHVASHLHHRRAGRAAAQGMEGAPQHRRHLIGAQDRLDGLGNALIGARRLKVGPGQGVQRVAGRQHQDRNVVGAGLRQAAERILGSRLRLHGDHAEPASVAGAAVTVRRHHRAALVAKRNRANAERGGGLNDRVLGEAGQPLHPLELEYLSDIVVSVHEA